MVVDAEAGVVSQRLLVALDLVSTLEQQVQEQSPRRADERVERFLGQLGRMLAAQRAALSSRLAALGTTGVAAPPPVSQGTPVSDTVALQAVAGKLGETIAVCTALYTAANLMFDETTGALVAQHLADLAQSMNVLGWLLPEVARRELQERHTVTCRCACASCSLGACLCVRNATDVAMHVWDGSAPFGSGILPERKRGRELLEAWQLGGLWPDDDGIVVRWQPRPGSPLADAGIRAGDRIVSVDGAAVRGNRELQAALRAHPIGDEVRLGVRRSAGATDELALRQV